MTWRREGPRRRPPLFWLSKSWQVFKKVNSSEENCIKQYFFANGNFSAAAPPFGAYSDWFSLKSSKQENKRRNLTSKNSVFLYEISLFGYAIHHQISKAWIQSAGLSSKYLWVVCWVNAGDIGKEKWPEFAIWYPSPAHPILLIHFTWKKDHPTACCPSYVCTYVFWLSWHLWRVKDYVSLGRQMLLLHSFGIVMKCCATLARDNFKWFLFDVVEIDFCYWISVRIHTHSFFLKNLECWFRIF